jgi:tetratricopeptide (TPR) repeat protein
VKIERALSLLPAIDAMPSVRALLLSTDAAGGAGALRIGVNDTVGKRDITAVELRERMLPEFERVVAHLASLYESYFSAVQALDGGAPEAAVRSLVTAGHSEQAVGRVEQAEVWYQAALDVAEGLVDRKPEIETLLALGALTRWLDFYDDSTRRYRRALVLAESVFDTPSAIAACVGLGLLLVEQEAWPGADAWLARALRLAERAEDDVLIAEVSHHQAEAARRRGAFTEAATALERARKKFEELRNPLEMARVLTTQGLVYADLVLPARAEAMYVEALAWVQVAKGNDALEAFIRYNHAKLHVAGGRFHEAEAEIRRAERLAVKHNQLRRLVQLYTLLGKLRGREGDDAGFVFFEQALQLARMINRRPAIEAQVYHEYGLFAVSMRQTEDGRAYLRRAREIFEGLGLQAEAERVVVDMRRSSA